MNSSKSVDGFRSVPGRRARADFNNAKPGANQQIQSNIQTIPGKSRFGGRFAPEQKTRHINPFSRDFWTKRRAAGAMAGVMIVAGGLFGGSLWLKLRLLFEGGGTAILQADADPATLRGEGDGRINILIVGRDDQGAGLTDTILLASINPIQKETVLLSIPRDLYVQTNDGSYSKINAIFPNTVRQYLNESSSNQDDQRKADVAGIKALQDVVQTKIGLPVHYYGMIDLKGFQKAINTVGGVDVNVPKELTVFDRLRLDGRNYTLDIHEGRQHFDGLDAMAFVRTRYTSERGDFDRAERQRLILTALKSKILSAGTYSSPIKISGLMGDFGDHIRTNMSLEEALRLYEIGQGIDNSSVASVGLADEPHELVVTENVHGQSVVIPRAGLDDYREIQHFVRNRLRDGFLAQEDAKVVVLNGTSIPGLATRTAEHLKSYGYTVTKIDDAPTRGYHTTIIVDLSTGKKKYTKRYLENRFFIAARGSLPDPQIDVEGADFVIILGQNEQARLANTN